MSISLLLLPVALALTAIVGIDKLEEWAASSQNKVPTNFINSNELEFCVRGAGYDAEKWGNSYKTHLQGEQDFFFWNLIDGQWVAVFRKSTPDDVLNRFIKAVERRAGRKVFGTTNDLTSPLVKLAKPVESIKTEVFPTSFRDENLLRKTLIKFGMVPKKTEKGELICNIGPASLRFFPSDDGSFFVEVNARELKLIYNSLSTIDEDYKHQIQKETLESLKQRAKERNLVIESEEMQEDNSILLTLTINN
ncbi:MULTISPECIES: hypothetical protein [unclassified Microcystis]|jgi:hypothetical protein|uniref:hypothetical protein n=1 Tax=unclassified Microcystis TaxID=2643300 RepID=UPI002586E3CC|nr:MULTISPECIES: hypothetical protein [unclassified Microcystis]MCA2761774.1 hypothetical protein [Microcystis sp. M151S2]NCS10622.1 hypothetical protein [Microcystis aeruginosa G13-09]NCS37946.1 hypothetical protein [Microcystis aeruginosa BS13-10]MCA2641632.1 hypothetical protein [Microcystis sp. M087S2]MCA2671378.1 hypothetical protein [Microcystis sp. M080S2]